MTVAARFVNVRAGLSTAREAPTTLPRDTVVTVLERRGAWIRIQAVGGRSEPGWLHQSPLEAAE
ncbi:MAG: SH3 domain-containing protein [Kiloniellaceae bacterium]